MTSGFRDLAESRLAFRDVVVGPTEAIIVSPQLPFRGGPRWPDFDSQLLARHCRGPEPVAMDEEPRDRRAPVESIAQGVWCGPVHHHYGHMIADFTMRTPYSNAFTDLPLIFTTRKGEGEAGVPAFVPLILDHLRVPRSRVRFVSQPTLVKELFVFPQPERLKGGAPSPRHLDFMDATYPSAVERDLEAVYVSRSRGVKGGIAGERCFDEAFEAAGIRVIWPETMPVADQIEVYRRAKTLIFSQGSAVHTLQLLGRLDARLIVINRRPGQPIAQASLEPRLRRIDYVHEVKNVICGLKMSGRRQETKGVSVLDEAAVFEKISDMLSRKVAIVDADRYRQAQIDDVNRWIAASEQKAKRHPDEAAAIRASARRAGFPGKVRRMGAEAASS